MCDVNPILIDTDDYGQAQANIEIIFCDGATATTVTQSPGIR